MINFKEEAIKAVKGREIDEFKFEYHFFSCKKRHCEYNVFYSGRRKINWEKIEADILKSINEQRNVFEDESSNIEIVNKWSGWITFKDGADWLEYGIVSFNDWRSLSRPSLKDKQGSE